MAAHFEGMSDFIKKFNVYESIFEAVEANDTAQVVSKFMEIIKMWGLDLSLHRELKSESKSIILRKEGNEAFKLDDFSNALKLYNEALSYAPRYSQAMKLAYSNRSALLYKTGNFSACLKDIETCMSLICPDDIAEKLTKRKIDCLNQLKKTTGEDKFIKNFFTFNVERNPSIPCASKMVKVIKEQGFPKVVAATDIQTGTVLAMESSFVSEINDKNVYVSCYYCQKTSLNLDPCCDCSYAMFCGKDCEDKCMRDYHAVECVLTPLFKLKYNDLSVFLKTVIKIKNKFDSWNDFILATNDIGMDSVRDHERIKEYTTSEIYDGNNKYSAIVWYKDTSKSLNYGSIYNAASYFAFAFYELINYSSFFPTEEYQMLRALQTMSRLLMYFATCNPNILKHYVPEHDLLNGDGVVVKGFYPFICKLTESCAPNVYGIQLNGTIALVALHPIKKGTEITHSRLMWANSNGTTRRATLNYKVYKTLCTCQICVENWNAVLAATKKTNFSYKHIEYLHQVNLLEVHENIKKGYKLEDCYKKLCEGLSIFADSACSKEYVAIFDMFNLLAHMMRKAHN